jgi:hypothetical protein
MFMPIEYMLRDYRVKPVEMDEWIEEWRAKIYPLRLKFGFDVVGAWRIGDDRFVWILSYKGKKGDFQKVNEEYYNSKDRRSMKPDPARHLSKVEHAMMTSVLQDR